MNKEETMTGFQIFRYQFIVKERHLDIFGHVNNATYLALLEEARWEFLNDGGIDLETIHKEKVGPVVLECHIRFLKELRLRQIFTIESQLFSWESRTGQMRQDIFDEQSRLCTAAKFTFGVFDMTSRKLIIPPERWQTALGIGK